MKPTLDVSRAPLVVATFFETITAEEAGSHFREIGDLADRFGKVAVVVDLTEAPIAADVLRRNAALQMRALFRRCGDRLIAVAHVVRSSVARATLNSVQRLAPPPFPSLVTSSHTKALAWAENWLGRGGPKLLAPPRTKQGDARVASGLARTLVAAARSRGLAVDQDLASLALQASALDDVDGYIPYSTLMNLVELFAARAGDQDFGLHAAEAFFDAASFGVVGFAARASSSLREAIERTARYAHLMNENTEISVTFDANGATIVDGPIPPLAWSRHYAEMAIAAFVVLSRRWTGVDFRVGEVGFRHAAPHDMREHRRLFGRTPRFAVDRNYLVIPAAVLDLGLRHGDAKLGQYFDRRLDELAATYSSAPGPLSDVREAMLRTLPGGTPTLAAIARLLGVSERTLQRRLGERGVTFNRILDSVRREVAIAAIAQPRVSVQELSLVCGFADVKAFRRAFRRWTGRSPREYRRDPHTA